MRLALTALALVAVPTLAAAHVVVAPTATTSGARVQAAFRVGHGCEGADTTALRIEIPAGVEEARPRAIPGYKLAIEKAPDGRIKAITWTGRLPDSQFDVFEIFLKAPDATGDLTFPVVQTCGKKTANWTPSMEVGPPPAPRRQ